MAEETQGEVLTEVRDGVLIVTINRPEAKNAMNKAAAEAIAAAMDRLDEDDSLRVAILTGAGGTFCSGMDLKGFLRGERPFVEGRGLAFPCDCNGQVDLDALSDRARSNYLYARAVVGREYRQPAVCRSLS